MENLHRDKYQKDISEDKWGDTEWRSLIVISRKRGEERKRARAEIWAKVSEDKWGDREQRTYSGITRKTERGRKI